jgi:hypothetical protein
MNPQLKGVENLEGTYLFDLERSSKALRLNRFLHGLTVPGKARAVQGKFRGCIRAGRPHAGGAAHGARARLGRAHPLRRKFFCLEKLGR